MVDVVTLLPEHGLQLVEDFRIPARAARFAPIPEYLRGAAVGEYLRVQGGDGAGLWAHQANGLERIGRHENVVVSTATASGKSLIFRCAALHRVLTEPELRVAVFYPLKALAADQLIGWKGQAGALGLGEATIGRIDGNVSIAQRNGVLANARIVLMTPDVCHAWMMSNLSEAPIRDFLAHLNLVILDEAHTLEGVFGSNFAFLFRRLKVARNILRRGQSTRHPMQVVAATATIRSPETHLELLTGMPFTGVGEDQDGSPQQVRHCMHASMPLGEESKSLAELQANLMRRGGSDAFITFVDSRKGVEYLAASTNRALESDSGAPAVLPYRAGFEAADRAGIEQALKRGSLHGVVSTSALELGIDIPSLTIGMNLGVPPTRKSYRQRVGRVGRVHPGTFVVFAHDGAFRRFGSTFEEYHQQSVERSYLYLDNRFMQYAHARCLVDEMDSLGADTAKALGAAIGWPQGFDKVFQAARPGGTRPREFDAIAQLGGDSPQYNYPLRNIGELNLKVARGGSEDSFGDLTLAQALRECYPGAIYYHLARPYKVFGWQTSGFHARIKVTPQRGTPRTRPRIQTWVNAALGGGDIIDNHYLSGDYGSMAECEMQITEIVKGFYDPGGTYHAYKELREKNPAMRERSRVFRTTGVLISVQDEWFADHKNRGLVADSLREIFCREYSVLPQDVGSVATNISVATPEGTERKAQCIAIFDQIYGSLRLTERLYAHFGGMLDRMERASSEIDEDLRETWQQAVSVMKRFQTNLSRAETILDELPGAEFGGGLMRVFKPGSVVAYREKGPLCTEVTIDEPAYHRTGAFGYRVRCKPVVGVRPLKRWIAARYLEPSGNDAEWSYCYWDPDTGEVHAGEEGGGG